jgi:hypothetical protein
VLVDEFDTTTSVAPNVKPRVNVIVSFPGKGVSKFIKCLDANASDVGLTANLKVAALADWLQTVIVLITVFVAAGTEYILEVVFAIEIN